MKYRGSYIMFGRTKQKKSLMQSGVEGWAWRYVYSNGTVALSTLIHEEEGIGETKFSLFS
jgi:hypothetical protein